ncbi:hypothetical protein J7E97_03395 [Streptomyces sp. ISL-66]|uniref:hypothetical protein n=1 Tax=Streptomyces sp. ISL-66 TaxID=2819186 RepID=UPI001BEA7F0F|nr:hypothetical protein [Streptomyces sp. ISL-66]MBT2466938.1 hypothetical protein [Streptomyces sp. ISL-66]
MRTSPRQLAAAALLGTLLAAAPAVTAAAAPSPTPSPKYEVGTVFSGNIEGMPYCGVGYGSVIIDQDQAVLVAGSGDFINAVLRRGQTMKDARDGTLTFNKDGKSITYNDYEHHGGKRVTEVCTPYE